MKTSDVMLGNVRAMTVEKLLEDDASGLRAYESLRTRPSFQLQLVLSGASLTEDDLHACIDLVEATSGADYKASSIGWHRSAKAEEMMDPKMILLLLRENSNPVSSARSRNNRIIGFISFMFTSDDPPHEDREVVYIYEIHLAESLRGQGLGSHLIRFAELVAQQCGISKIMLTVFTANTGAKALYERLGYSKDACSPRDKVMRRKVVKADYMIMSKELAGS